MSQNTLYYGDNLDILRRYIADESVDLIYLDPPFNSNRSYNVLFREANGTVADSQIRAFDDTWHWTETAEATLRETGIAAPSSPRSFQRTADGYCTPCVPSGRPHPATSLAPAASESKPHQRSPQCQRAHGG